MSQIFNSILNRLEDVRRNREKARLREDEQDMEEESYIRKMMVHLL